MWADHANADNVNMHVYDRGGRGRAIPRNRQRPFGITGERAVDREHATDAPAGRVTTRFGAVE